MWLNGGLIVNDIKRKQAKKIYEKQYGKIPEFHHIHHLISIKSGGTNDIDNLICVSHEDHFKIHYSNWKRYGNYEDLYAAKLLSKNSLDLTNEEKKLICSKAGSIGGKKQVENKIGIHSQTKEERLKCASDGGKAGLFSINWYIKNGYTEKQAVEQRIKDQSNRGKIGGHGNKGFIWINDGKNSFKYTKEQQKNKSVSEYLKENDMVFGKINNTKSKKVQCPFCKNFYDWVGIGSHKLHCKKRT